MLLPVTTWGLRLVCLRGSGFPPRLDPISTDP